ncbi:hypothetical protein L5G32_02950 [Gordonia sp. HY002]|uniref:hypothetical protein n=1 Tax=Gordonia zhenghanii TaxID=2911516 RepID=UPI001EF11236|nr:hypothetical protein [Gordonia zhenghanii]MCF8569225.1 hypothetical protein [Gordonia zhenghanii]MCF8603543.1 hypothetical protein [Gordonia zhenghanii]
MQPPQNLHAHDIAIWHTAHINQVIERGDFSSLPQLGTPFALARDERALAQGVFRLYNFEAAGNGSYVHQNGFVFGTGAVGWVSTHHLHFATPYKYFQWDFGSIHSMTLVGPGQVQFAGQSVDGPIAWILESDWAELAFTIWARARHAQHPQFITAGWIPPGWHERAAHAGWQLS